MTRSEARAFLWPGKPIAAIYHHRSENLIELNGITQGGIPSAEKDKQCDKGQEMKLDEFKQTIEYSCSRVGLLFSVLAHSTGTESNSNDCARRRHIRETTLHTAAPHRLTFVRSKAIGSCKLSCTESEWLRTNRRGNIGVHMVEAAHK